MPSQFVGQMIRSRAVVGERSVVHERPVFLAEPLVLRFHAKQIVLPANRYFIYIRM